MVDLSKETPDSLGALRYKDLQALAKGHGIRANQCKGALIEQIQLVLESKVRIEPACRTATWTVRQSSGDL